MNGLLEFVFEGISSIHLADMTAEMIREQGNIIDVMQNGVEIPLQLVLNSDYWSNLGPDGEGIACTVNLRNLAIENKRIERATLQTFHYKDANDVFVLLSSDDCKKGGLFDSEEMFQWAKSTAVKYNAENFLGGLEPADDENTQLYSKNGVSTIKTL